nr:MAG TPA: hypothetical protein [Caudoviricetes sp.]
MPTQNARINQYYATIILFPLYLLYTSYYIIGFLSIGILHKNSCENLLNLPLDKKLGAPQSSARRRFYHIQGTLSIVKVNKKNHPIWVIFHLVSYGFEVDENGNELVFKKRDTLNHFICCCSARRVSLLNAVSSHSAHRFNNLAQFLILHFSYLHSIYFLERVAVVSGTTAKAIGKGEKNTNKSSVLSRDNQFRVIDRPNHAGRAKAVEIVSV